jgi:hypothetical protein
MYANTGYFLIQTAFFAGSKPHQKTANFAAYGVLSAWALRKP